MWRRSYSKVRRDRMGHIELAAHVTYMVHEIFT